MISHFAVRMFATVIQKETLKISDLLFFVSYFTSQNKGIKFGYYFFDVCCVNLKLFGQMSDTHYKLQYGNKYNH